MAVKNENVLYETLLCLPSMNDAVKVDFKIPRKMMLLIARFIECGFDANASPVPIALMACFSTDELDEIKKLPAELLQKAGLANLNEKMKALL